MYKQKIKYINKTTIPEINTLIYGIQIIYYDKLSEKSYINIQIQKNMIFIYYKLQTSAVMPQTSGQKLKIIILKVVKRLVRKGTDKHIAEGAINPFSIPNTPMLRAQFKNNCQITKLAKPSLMLNILKYFTETNIIT